MKYLQFLKSRILKLHYDMISYYCEDFAFAFNTVDDFQQIQQMMNDYKLRKNDEALLAMYKFLNRMPIIQDENGKSLLKKSSDFLSYYYQLIIKLVDQRPDSSERDILSKYLQQLYSIDALEISSAQKLGNMLRAGLVLAKQKSSLWHNTLGNTLKTNIYAIFVLLPISEDHLSEIFKDPIEWNLYFQELASIETNVPLNHDYGLCNRDLLKLMLR